MSAGRFFGVGCLKLGEPSRLIRQVESWRDVHHWYGELHFVDVTRGSVPRYRELIDMVTASDAEFSCFVVDRLVGDPVRRFGTPYRAYEKLAAQLLIGSIRPREIVSVLADQYKTPNNVFFEEAVRAEVNGRLRRLAVTPLVRLDSRSTTPLQIVDLLTSAVTFEFRQSAGLAGLATPKAHVARYLRDCYAVTTFLAGCRDRPRLNVALYSQAPAPALAGR